MGVLNPIDSELLQSAVLKDADAEMDAHYGIAVAPSPNAKLKIGAGSGSLTDAPVMGLKVKIDSDAATTPDGIQGNLNIVAGTPAGPMHGLVSRVDVNDPAGGVAGDTVALWGDVFVRAASGRPTWSANCYVQIVAGVAYAQPAIGAELGVFNDGTNPNTGGVLHLVSRGAQTTQFDILIGEAAGVTHQARHGIIIKDGTTGPLANAIYFGAIDAGNEPTGTPRFRIDAAGLVTAGGAIAAGANPVYQVLLGGEANPRLTVNSDGSVSLGSGAAAPVVSLRRPGANQIGTGTNIALVLGTGTSGGTVYLQGSEQTADPAAPPADGWRLYAKDNGSGKTQLGVLFNTGAFIPIATQA